MIRIAFYGKGGIGKSTIASNMAISCARKGMKVLFIGCDPKADSTRAIMGKRIPTVLDVVEKNIDSFSISEIMFKGQYGIYCIEAGGPEAGSGCAGLGITLMQTELERLDVFQESWDVIIYDVLGDVVCGGFAVPIRKNFVDKVVVVSSSELMSVYAANNILKCVKASFPLKSPLLGGIILNKYLTEKDINIIKNFADKTNSRIIGKITYNNEMTALGYKPINRQADGANFIEKEMDLLLSSLLDASICTNPSPLTNMEFDCFAEEIEEMLGKNI